ncbi:alpha/beta fold hydrolase [Candidatus Thorarchaeota archaeon]|nr:MAG: alpha/beta fold hydrolase [Candidatus Thorarchaeota archaeon]
MLVNIPSLRDRFKEPHQLIQTSDNQTLFLRKWEPEGEEIKDSAILLLHGITAYSGPYGMLANPLAKLGFTVYGLDLRGHGLSDGNRGDSPGMERFIKDLCETIDFVRQNHQKIVLLGHSLGVLSSSIVLNNYLKKIDGAVLLSGARTSRPNVYPAMSITQKLKIVFRSLFNPSKPVIRYYREGMVGLDDPLFNFNYTYRFMKIVGLRDFKFPDLGNMPIFVGIGDNDELFSVEACRSFYDEIPSTNKMFHVITGGRHAEFPSENLVPLGRWLDEQFD